MNIALELSKFNNIKFYDGPHTYFIGDKQVLSATGLYRPFTDPFETEKQLRNKVKKNLREAGIMDSTQEEISLAMGRLNAEWVFKNAHGRFEGTMIHRYLEGLMANKDIEEDRSMTYEGLTFSDIEDTYFLMKKQAKLFYDTYVATGILIPIRSELVVGNYDMEIAGQIDQLFWDTRLNAICLYDWKTNRKVDMNNQYSSMNHGLSHLDCCDHIKFSLQLSTYKYILESTTNIRLHPDFFVVWFNEQNSEGKIIKCQDLTEEVKYMLAYKKQHPQEFAVVPYERKEIPSPKVKQATAWGDLLTL